jgi:hypothetical protein
MPLLVVSLCYGGWQQPEMRDESLRFKLELVGW